MADTLTAYITIGNSDNKLSQQDWSAYCYLVEKLVQSYATHVFFMGYTLPNGDYQNACFSFATTPEVMTMIRGSLRNVARQFRQDSIALAVVGEVEMVKP